MTNVMKNGFIELSANEASEINGGWSWKDSVALSIGGPVGYSLYYVYKLSYRNAYNEVYYGN